MFKVLTWMSTVIEKYSFSNCNNSKDFLTLIIDMYSANQEDPIMLNNILQNLCQSFGRINKVSVCINVLLLFLYFYNVFL